MVKKSKKESGFTLIEVIIAVVLVTMSFGAIMNMTVNSFRNAAQTQDMTTATYTAQIRMEELFGQTKTELLDHNTIGLQPESNGQTVEYNIVQVVTIPGVNNCFKATITVRRDTKVLCILEDVFYAAS